MNSMERMKLTLSHKEADRVPIYPILSGVTRKLVGATYEQWSKDAEICATSLIKAAEEFEQDCIVSLIDLSVECDAWGADIIYPENEAAHPNYSNVIIKEVEDYNKIKKVDFRTSKRMMMQIDLCKKLVERKGNELPIVSFVFGPLGVLSMLRGQENMYMDIYDEPELVKEAASQINETLKDYVNAIIDTGVHAIMFDTLFSSGSIMSKSMWLEMEGELVRELADVCHSRNVMVMIHNCGEKIYFDAQIQTMNPIAISFACPPDDCKDFAQCKEKYGDKITLIGCVSPNIAIIGTDEQWIDECKKYIDFFKADGGFVLATGCEYPANADFHWAKLMGDVAKSYGKYN